MQGLHQQQQQLAALLSVALPKDGSTASPSSAEEDDSARFAALNSLHRAILYPPNALLVAHSSSFLSQGFSQLLSDKSYSIRRSAAIAYGGLCAILCSIPLTSNGRHNHSITSGLVERFVGWALPLLTDVVGDGSVELALEALREFLTVGEGSGIELCILPIIKACQELLEDERTSLRLLHRLLGVLTLISVKCVRCFQPHFVDIVDLLLGWALVPDLPESDRCVIMDSFLQFRKHWLNNLQFSLGLLSKFLDDMDVLLQDGSPGTPEQFRRLLALLSCFLTVLKATATGMLEMNLLEQITEPLTRMVPQLLACLSMVGKEFGWSKWVGESWRCLTLLAEILGEKFAVFYLPAVDILFQSLNNNDTNPPVRIVKIPSLQVHGALKTNLQLLSLQKLGILPSSLEKILQFNSPISQLRLHPNHLVTGSAAATYLFLLQHGNSEVVDRVMTVLFDELELLNSMHGDISCIEDDLSDRQNLRYHSKLELFALFRFDLTVLLGCVSLGSSDARSFLSRTDIATSYNERSVKLTRFIVEKLDPFKFPVQNSVELQVHVIRTLTKLSEVEFLSKYAMIKGPCKKVPVDVESEKHFGQNCSNNGIPFLIVEFLEKYSIILIKSLDASSPLSVKLEALQWVRSFCVTVITVIEDVDSMNYFITVCGCTGIGISLLSAILDVTSDREMKVRFHAASVLELLLQARLIYPGYLYAIAEVVLEKLGDPDSAVKNAFVRVLSLVLPAAIYVCGLLHCEVGMTCRPGNLRLGNRCYLHWKQAFALRQLPQKLHSQQLVSILSYISQRWKVPLSSWVQRLINVCQGGRNVVSLQFEEAVKLGNDSLWMDSKVMGNMLDRICSVNNLAAAWWCIHEAARYCISVRLRTNLGGPTQTFAALERMLLDVAHILQLETEQTDSNLNIVSSGAHLLPMRLLLDFVEALKKNVYNAYDGSCVLPAAAWQSSLFFRANKKVCEEWFSRICEPMMNAGLALKCQAAIYHYCGLRLQELRNLVASVLKDKPRMQVADNLHNLRGRFAADVMRLLRHAALALCQSQEPEGLIGLQKWASVTFSSLFVEENQVMSQIGNVGPFFWITGLVYQAQGQYEKAAAHFSLLLQTEEALSSMGSDGIQFAIERVIDSYTALSDWKSLEAWLLELQALRAKHAGKSYSGALTTAGNEINAVHALACFDEGDCQSAWAYLDLTPKSSNKLTLDPKLALQRSEQILLQAMLLKNDGKLDKVPQEIENSKLMLDKVLAVLPLDGLPEAAAYATQYHCILAFEEGHKVSGKQEESKQLHTILNLHNQIVQSPISRVHQDCNLWLKVFRICRTVHPTSSITFQLCQKLMTLARKQKNLMMARRLSHWLKDHLSSCSKGRFHNLLSVNLLYEDALLMHAENELDDAFTNLWSIVRDNVLSPATSVSDTGESSVKARACLKLSVWLRQKNSDLSLENVFSRILEDFNHSSVGSPEISLSSGNLPSERNFDLILEEIVGIATKLSSHLCPTMGKSWLSYASWCYSQARNSLSASRDTALQSCLLSPFLLPEIPPGRFQLTKEEISIVESIVTDVFDCHSNPSNVPSTCGERIVRSDSEKCLENENAVKALVHQVLHLIVAAAEGPGAEESNGERQPATLISQLQMSFLRADPNLETSDILSAVTDLVEVWLSLRRRRVSLFGHAARGYMQYLSYSSSKLWEGTLAFSDLDPVKQKTESHTLRATLYILNIVLNYGVELREMLEAGLSAVPLLPWQEITPQLFARLSSHPEHVVRKQLEGLLMMLAKLSPCSIVYPTLVDINAYEGEPSEELQHILGCLGELHPRLITDVQLVITQLGNVTVLWEELWLGTLQDLHSDVVRRINMLKDEAARIAENVTLSQSEKNKINAAKYSAMMAPIVVALERRLASTSRKPETPHEMWFQREYGEQLKSAILAFRTPPASAAALGDVWQAFHTIAASLATYQRKLSIPLCDVAPQLALLSSSDVPMPGLEKQIAPTESAGSPIGDLQKTVTIASFCEQVTILSTKTKPKKLTILGSDGQKYTYLLKGREDLRLDARIMQLLQAINGFLHSSTDSHSRLLSIHHYSVTPISGRAGLIQWVDNVISIYSVFKAWQNRVQLAQLAGVGTGSSNTVPPPVPRPSDMFYGKIMPALKEKGIRRVISRRDWPHEVKRKVLLDLMKETPRQLLYQELWCSSEGFKAFNSKLNRYSGSVAAMSMVGHILGLGDRHLDNVLVDFCTGEVVHIDYNVCFDKGQKLKIPEIVPFRLTQTIEAALGLTGTEGTFRANCEAVLGVLRRNKDIILMLLDVFVWDPLVEWTRGDSHDEAAIGGEERKGMELAVSLSLFASRMQEIRVPLQEHHDLLLATLPAVESTLKSFSDILNQYEVVYAIFYRADQERSNLLLRETSAKSIVAEATCNSEEIRASFEIQAHDFAQAKALAADKAQEVAIWMEQHGRVLDALRSGSLPDMRSCIKLSGMEEALSLTAAVLVAGVPLTIVPEPTQAQCHDLDGEVSQLIADLDGGLSCATKALQEYALALQRILPLNYNKTSPIHGWAQLLQLSVNNLSPDMLSLARRQASDLIAKSQGDGLDSIQQKHGDLCLQVEKYIMEIQKVEEEHSELLNSVGPETEAKAKGRLLSAFTKYMQSAGFSRKENDASSVQLGKVKRDMTWDAKLQVELEEKEKVLSILHGAACALSNEVKGKVIDILSKSTGTFGWRHAEDTLHSDSETIFCQFEEQVEKCVLVAGYINELCQLLGVDLSNVSTEMDTVKYSSEHNFLIFQASLLSCRILVGQMTEFVLPEFIKSVVSHNSEVMDAFGSLSQIRGSIDTALEQLVEVELEKASLIELEQNYFVKVGHITEQLLALEEASVKSRDHLSWEEAEELASQEEACRAELDQLRQTWNQKDMRASSLMKREVGIRNSLVSTERCFLSLISTDQGRDPHTLRSKALLAALVKPFLELESIDQTLASFGTYASTFLNGPSNQVDMINSGYSISESVWKFANVLNDHSFFIWKIGIMDFFLDSCIHDISSVDLNLGFDQLYNVLKKKLEMQLQEHVSLYLKERVAPAFLAQLEKEMEHLKQSTEVSKETNDQKDVAAVKRVQLMLEEYCNAHETARAARSAASLMKRQLTELKEALRRTVLEIIQMEWLHNVPLPCPQKIRVVSQNILVSDDSILPIIVNLNRPKLMENMQSAMSSIARAVECLQACEGTSLSAEGQLERAMGWACAGPTPGGNTSVKGSGIPTEFHDHLLRRRQMLWAAREHASDIIKICTSVLEFEASRDGVFQMPVETSSAWIAGDVRTWQHAFLNIITRLDLTYRSFTCAEQEWKLAQSSMEAAANSLFSASNELCIASLKAKSASSDLQSTLAAMQDCASEASVAVSAFARVSRGHTALTSECGSMLEEVLAITEGLHDVHNLGKEAAAVHNALMDDLSKANKILLPLEAVLSKDVTAMTDAISRDRESNLEIPPIHGQAIYQSYCLRLRDACQALKPLVPSVTFSVKELHSMLTRLARTASLHAGNLHKALEGLGESEVVRSQEMDLSRSNLATDAASFDNEERDLFVRTPKISTPEFVDVPEFSLQDDGWISPHDSVYSSIIESSSSSAEKSPHDAVIVQENVMEEFSERLSGGKKVNHLNIQESSLHEQSKSQNLEVNTGDVASASTMFDDPGKHLQALTLSDVKATITDCYSLSPSGKEKSEVQLVDRDGTQALNQGKDHRENREAPTSNLDGASRITRGKNPYALSVLRRVAMKLDGRDVENNRGINVSEQVDYLLRQATSIDNLCNMYEGWTPWI